MRISHVHQFTACSTDATAPDAATCCWNELRGRILSLFLRIVSFVFAVLITSTSTSRLFSPVAHRFHPQLISLKAQCSYFISLSFHLPGIFPGNEGFFGRNHLQRKNTSLLLCVPASHSKGRWKFLCFPNQPIHTAHK